MARCGGRRRLRRSGAPVERRATELTKSRVRIALPAATRALGARARLPAQAPSVETAPARAIVPLGPTRCGRAPRPAPVRARAARQPTSNRVPHVRQNCVPFGLSAPQRAQRTPPAAGAAACTAGAPKAPRGVPQAWQNAFCGGFSRWHWRQSMRRQWNRPKRLRQDRCGIRNVPSLPGCTPPKSRQTAHRKAQPWARRLLTSDELR